MNETPHQLWTRAALQYPHDTEKRRVRYHALMVEHGHIIEGKREPLPCGWPFLSTEDATRLNDDLAKMARDRRRSRGFFAKRRCRDGGG